MRMQSACVRVPALTSSTKARRCTLALRQMRFRDAPRIESDRWPRLPATRLPAEPTEAADHQHPGLGLRNRTDIRQGPTEDDAAFRCVVYRSERSGVEIHSHPS